MTTPVGYLTWPDEISETPVTCCLLGAPCAFHLQFGSAIRSPLRTQSNAAVAANPVPDQSAAIIAPAVVDPPAPVTAPADSPASA